MSYLLTGTVRWDRSRAGHNIDRVSPALQRSSDGAQVWSEPYQDEVTGVFEIQGKVAERVAHVLRCVNELTANICAEEEFRLLHELGERGLRPRVLRLDRTDR